MHRGPRFADLRHAALLTLAAVAIALKVLVPTGFMLAPEADAGVPIVLCTAYGAKTVRVSADQAPPASDHDGGGQVGHDQPCGFAVQGAALTVPLAAPFAYPAEAVAEASVAAPVAVAPGRGLAAPPPPSHAPPRLV